MTEPRFTQRELDALAAAISGWCEDCDSSDSEKHFKHLDSAYAKACQLKQGRKNETPAR